MGEPAPDIPAKASEVVTLPVELDITNSGQTGARLLAALETHPEVVIADMSMTEFCDSSGIRSLVLASKSMADNGAELRIVLSSPDVRRILHVVGADEILRLYPDIPAAMAP
jgi:anti-sigma B factor antagonist